MENLTHRAVGARVQRPAEPHAPQEAEAASASILIVYAEEVVRLEMLVHELERDKAGLRELLSVVLEQVSAMTVAQRSQRDRLARLLQELRELRRGASWRPAA